MNIVILDDYQDAVRKLACAQLLHGLNAKVYNNTVRGLGQLVMRLRDADVVVLIHERTSITRALLEKLPRLKLIALAGSMGPHVDLQACSDHGVAVAQGVNVPVSTAELTWALLMAAMRRLPQYVANLKHAAWQQAGLRTVSMPANFGLASRLQGKVLGIWGYGRVGRLVASYGKAFGMQVLVWGSEATRTQARNDGLEVASSKDALFLHSDVLSLHLQLLPQTRHSVRLTDLARMKPTALLLNTAHAELIEPEALAVALQRGRPGMAAVDVYEIEPIMQGHALLRLENCVCSPHIGHVEKEGYEEMLSVAFHNILSFAHGQPQNILNPEVLRG